MFRFVLKHCLSIRIVRPYVQSFRMNAISAGCRQVLAGRSWRNRVTVAGKSVGKRTCSGFCKNCCTRLLVTAVDRFWLQLRSHICSQVHFSGQADAGSCIVPRDALLRMNVALGA